MSRDNDPTPRPTDPNDPNRRPAGPPPPGDEELADLSDISFIDLGEVDPTTGERPALSSGTIRRLKPVPKAEPVPDAEEVPDAEPIPDAEDAGGVSFDLSDVAGSEADAGERTLGVSREDLENIPGLEGMIPPPAGEAMPIPDTSDWGEDLVPAAEPVSGDLPPGDGVPYAEDVPFGEDVPEAETASASDFFNLPPVPGSLSASGLPFDDIPEAEAAGDSGVVPMADPVDPTAQAGPPSTGNYEPVAPVAPGSGWFDSQSGELPLPPEVANLPDDDGIEAGMAEPIPGVYGEGSDIFSGGPVPTGTPAADSDVIAATAYGKGVPITPYNPDADPPRPAPGVRGGDDVRPAARREYDHRPGRPRRAAAGRRCRRGVRRHPAGGRVRRPGRFRTPGPHPGPARRRLVRPGRGRPDRDERDLEHPARTRGRSRPVVEGLVVHPPRIARTRRRGRRRIQFPRPRRGRPGQLARPTRLEPVRRPRRPVRPRRRRGRGRRRGR